MDEPLNSIAKVVLVDRFEEFAQLHEQFQTDPSSVIGRDDLARILSEDAASDDLLWAFAYVNGRLEWIDWTGEEDSEQLKNFVAGRIQDLTGSDMDWAFLEKFERDLDFSKLKRGEYIVKKVRCIDEALRKTGFVLGELNRGDDQYYPFVASLKVFEAVEGMTTGITTVIRCCSA